MGIFSAKPRSFSDSGPPRSSGFLSSPGWGSTSRRASKILQERDVNIRSETQSICSRQSSKSFMSGISIGSMKSAASRQSIRSAKSNQSKRSNLSRTSRTSKLSRASRLSIKSISTCKSSRSFCSIGTYTSSGLSHGGRSQSTYGHSSQAIYDWDDGWKTSLYPKPEPVHLPRLSSPGFFRVSAESIKPQFNSPFPESPSDINRLEKVALAAKNGNDHLIDFLMSSSLADPDPPPIEGRVMAYSTPMLASIGQKNIKVIQVLLKQKGFNPTRQFQGVAYQELAERRQGPVWKEEVRILKQAYDGYESKGDCASSWGNEGDTVSPANKPHTTAWKMPTSISLPTRIGMALDPRAVAVEHQGLSKYFCTRCRKGFTQTRKLRLHEMICQEILETHQQRNVQIPIRSVSKPHPPWLLSPGDKDNGNPAFEGTVIWKRTGGACFPCRRRRIRCDAGEAACNNCISSGRSCQRPACFSCYSQTTSVWRRMPEGHILCNLCWDASRVQLSPSQNTSVSQKRNRVSSSPRWISKIAKLTDDTRHGDSPQLGSKHPMRDIGDHKRTGSPSEVSLPSGSSLSSPRRASGITSTCTTPSQGESEASSSSMNEDSEDGLDEEESIHVRRAERKQDMLRELMGMIYSSYNRLATSDTAKNSEAGSSSDAKESPSGGQSISNLQRNSRDNKGKRPLPRNSEDNDKEEDGEGHQPKRVKSGADDDGLDRARKFACPYYQRNHHQRQSNINLPRRACYGPGFSSVHRVKEHLFRAHMQPLVCPRCDTQMDSEPALKIHARQDPPCAMRSQQAREGISSVTEKLLRSRNRDFNKKTEAEKWRHVYITLFPADNPNDLPSPYHENYIEANFASDSPQLNTMAKRYDEFIQRELFPRIYRVLETKIDEALDSAERDVTEKLKSQLQGIFRDVHAELRNEFQDSDLNQDGPNSSETPDAVENVPIPGIDITLPDMWSLNSSAPPWSALEMTDRSAAPNFSVPQFHGEAEDIPSASFDFDFLADLTVTSNNQNSNSNIQNSASITAPVPFKAKATYDYASNHAGDLEFRMGQIITVMYEEDAHWYGGEYVDDGGVRREGIFPRNVVERYQPPTPPRPTRSHRGIAEPGIIGPLWNFT